MRVKSAKKSNTDKTHSNGNYTIGGLVFPSYDLFNVLRMIDENLSLLYTKTGEEYEYEPIFDSQARKSVYNFDNIYHNIKYYISVFENVSKNDNRVSEFIYYNRLSRKFSSLFDSIYTAFIEATYNGDNFDNVKKRQYEKIKKIVRRLAHNGVDPFKPYVL